MAAERRIENAQIASPCGWTPFDGVRVTGWPMATIVRGNLVMRDGALVQSLAGRPVGFC
jgi:dihydroorotase